ncbi:MAG: helix-turn-helix domain-containing protein [Oscillospiraceae bacterium]|jgi:transcriptional regulator with XRE-family HTH domain
MTDTNKLRQFMEARGYTVRRLASAVGISHEAMYQKINNERGFKASEIMNIAEVLGLSRSERDSIFFCR